MSVGISTIRLRMLASICGLLVYLPSKKPALCHLDVLSKCDGTDAQPPLFAEPTHRIMWGYTFEDLARRAQEEAATIEESIDCRYLFTMMMTTTTTEKEKFSEKPTEVLPESPVAAYH